VEKTALEAFDELMSRIRNSLCDEGEGMHPCPVCASERALELQVREALLEATRRSCCDTPETEPHRRGCLWGGGEPPISEHVCYFCKKRFAVEGLDPAEYYCYGCNEYVCEACSVNDAICGNHDVMEHAAEPADEDASVG